MVKMIRIITISVFCLLICSCGKDSNKKDSKNTLTDADYVDAEAAEGTESDAVTTEYLTESFSLSEDNYSEPMYDETIEYGEIYNDNNIVIRTTEFEHDRNKCSVMIEIENNRDNDIIVNELSYAVNYVNYHGDRVDYSWDDPLMKASVASHSSAKYELKFRTILNSLLNQIVGKMDVLLLISENDKKIDEPYIEIMTDKYDGVAKYIEYPTIEENDHCVYENPKDYFYEYEDIYYFNTFIYNKTDKIFVIESDALKVNGYNVIEDSTKSYEKARNKNGFIGYLDSDYFSSGKIYIFPHCKQMLFFYFHNNKFLENNNIDKITSISFRVKYYLELPRRIELSSDEITYEPNYESE